MSVEGLPERTFENQLEVWGLYNAVQAEVSTLIETSLGPGFSELIEPSAKDAEEERANFDRAVAAANLDPDEVEHISNKIKQRDELKAHLLGFVPTELKVIERIRVRDYVRAKLYGETREEPDTQVSSREFAMVAHEGQGYKDGVGYFHHVEMAASLAESLNYPQEVVDVCYLHDVIEKAGVTEEELREAGFSEQVVNAIVAMTYTDDDRLAGVDQIDKSKSNPLSHVGKFCDSSASFNSTVIDGAPESATNRDALASKYWVFRTELRSGLPTPAAIKGYLNAQRGD